MKKQILPAIVLGAIVSMSFLSCKDDNLKLDTPVTEKTVAARTEEIEKQRIEFSRALAKSMKEKQVRTFLKTQALQLFDGDYDVIYALVKDQRLEGGETFEQVLARNSSSTTVQSWAENLPLATIFVPTLEGFSAEKWNVDTQIPDVALDNSHQPNKVSDKIAALTADLVSYELDAKKAPRNPVIVIKENERIITKNKSNLSSRLAATLFEKKSNEVIFENPYNQYYFIGDVNPKASLLKRARTAANRPVPPSLQFGIYHMSGWANEPGNQRDWVYYRIWPKFNDIELVNPYINGGIDYDWSKGILGDLYYIEKMTKFKFVNINGLQAVTDSWTEGSLEFHVIVSFMHRDGTMQNDLKVFYCNEQDLRDGSNNPKEFDPDLEINQWDMYRYGDEWKFGILEHDISGTESKTITSKSTFGLNFEIGADSVTKKLGVKFGVSSSFVKTKTEVVTINYESDQLGDARVLFDNPIVVPGSDDRYSVSTGAVNFTIEPVIKYNDQRPYPYVD